MDADSQNTEKYIVDEMKQKTSNDINEMLYEAAWIGDHLQIKKLLKEGANPHGKDYRGNTAMHTAVMNNNKEAVKILLLWKSEPNKNMLKQAIKNTKREYLLFSLLFIRRSDSSKNAITKEVEKGRSIVKILIGAMKQ